MLRELEKIKKERAEEQERKVGCLLNNRAMRDSEAYPNIKEREAQEQNSAVREAEIAAANPLLNLQAALSQEAAGPSGGSFAVKKRWDDGMFGTIVRLSSL